MNAKPNPLCKPPAPAALHYELVSDGKPKDKVDLTIANYDTVNHERSSFVVGDNSERRTEPASKIERFVGEPFAAPLRGLEAIDAESRRDLRARILGREGHGEKRRSSNPSFHVSSLSAISLTKANGLAVV